MLNGKTVRDALHLYLEADEAIFDKEISKSVNCFKGNRNVSGFITHLHVSLKPPLLSKEMVSFFTDRGYSLSFLENDLQRVATISRHDALRLSEQSDTTVDTGASGSQLFNIKIQRLLLQNFRILSIDEQTRCVFPQPPFVAYKRDVSLRNMLVHSTDHPSVEQPGSGACQRPRSNHCGHISSVTEIRGLESSFTIRDHFTCQSENLVYCKSCALLYIVEAGRNLRS